MSSLGACLLCKKPTCDCKKATEDTVVAGASITPASKLKLKRWLDENDNPDIGALSTVVGEIVLDDSKVIVAAVFEELANRLRAQATGLREGAQKRLKEEETKRPPSPEL
jgi:hypothetical protein